MSTVVIKLSEEMDKQIEEAAGIAGFEVSDDAKKHAVRLFVMQAVNEKINRVEANKKRSK